jgi:tetratricopeptide (TPR) repeat protein
MVKEAKGSPAAIDANSNALGDLESLICDEGNDRQGETQGNSPDRSIPPSNEKELRSESKPWWIDFIKEEGLLNNDTDAIIQNGSMFEVDDFDDVNESEETKEVFEVDENVPLVDDDISVDDEADEEWEERLWDISRSHWNYQYNGPSRLNVNETTADEAEMAFLQGTVGDSDKDQEHILKFQNQLLACIAAYIQVFGNVIDSSVEKPRSHLHAEATKMSPYVPLAVARRLFIIVLRHLKAADDEVLLYESDSPIKISSPQGDNFFYFVEHITQVLFSSEMGVFLTYKVELQSETTNKTSKGSEGKRVRTDGIADDRQRKMDTERTLYGDMYAEEKKEDGDDSAIDGSDPDCPEEEVRIREGIKNIVKSLVFPGSDNDWTVPFVQEVLLSGFLSTSLSDDPMSVSNFTSARMDKSSETSLAYMYAIRYFPHFYIRSCWKTLSFPSFDLLAQYFGDAKLIRNRLVVLGIYTGVMVHIGELDALFKELCSLESFDDMHWDEFYRDVHRSIEACLSAVLEENMRSADFLPSKTVHGIDWKITEIRVNPSFQIELDHTHIVSICLEIGRSFHFQGVILGKLEQERVTKEVAVDTVLQRANFDDEMTELEIDAYLEAQSAFQGALQVLRRAEGVIKEKHRATIQEAAEREVDDLVGSPSKINRADRQFDPAQAKAMKHIHEARVTIELYLSDTLTTLAYCYEAKLSEFPLALKCYNDSLAIYTRHVGKGHPTVLHALQSVGAIHLEIKQWREASRCFSECLDLMKRQLPSGARPNSNGVVTLGSPAENADMAMVMQCLGVARSELGDHDAAFDSISISIDQMALTVLHDKLPQDNVGSSVIVRPPNDPFICDSLAKLVDVLFAKLNSLKVVYARRRLGMLYGDEEEYDIESLDEPRLARLQVERRAIEIARDAVTMRKAIFYGEPDQQQIGPRLLKDFDVDGKDAVQWFQLLDLMQDLLKLGKLLFRRCDYDDAIDCWMEALKLTSKTGDEMLKSSELPMSRAVAKAFGECRARRVDTLGELMHLIGIAFCRMGRNDEAISWFEKSLSQLEEKRRMFTDSGQNIRTDEEWDILDMDTGYSEHAIGLSHFCNNQFTAATAHFRESLRLFEAIAARRKARQSLPQQGGDGPELKPTQPKGDQKKAELDISINSAIAAVMLSLGTLYHGQQKIDRARRFLEGAIQIVYSTTHRILASPKGGIQPIKSITGFSDLSLVVSVIRVGDAHRRIAMICTQKNNIVEAKLAFETAMRYLESTNLETRLSLSIDDEAHLESVSQAEMDGMLLSCYEQMMTMITQSNEDTSGGASSWWRFGGQNQRDSNANHTVGGLTREDLLFRLGNLSAKRGTYDSAIRCFVEARELTEARLGTSDHAIVGNILFDLGNVYRKIYNGGSEKSSQKARERAIDSFVESLRIAKMTSGPDSLAAAEVMEALASVLMQDEAANPDEYTYTDDDGATSFLRDAVAIRNLHRSEMNLPFAQSMHHLGLLRLRQHHAEVDEDVSRRSDKKLDEAISCLSQALRVRRTLLGDHLDVANTANCLGVALWRRAISPNGSRHATVHEAIKQLNDALFIRTSFLEKLNQNGPTTINTAKSHDWRKELDGTEDIGSVVMKTVENMYDIGRVHESQGNLAADSACLNNAIELMDIWTEKLSSIHGRQEKSTTQIAISVRNLWKAKLYYGLGADRFELGDFAEAAVDFEKSLKFRGLDSIETATSNETFDAFFRLDPNQAKKEGAGLTPLASAVTMEKLALSYDKTGKSEEALRCYAFCLRVYGEHFGNDSLKVAAVLRHIGTVYQERHDYKRCVRALQRALHIGDSIDGASYIPRVEDALVYLRLARSLMALGAYDDVALDHFQSAVSILEDVNQIMMGPSIKDSAPQAKKASESRKDAVVDGCNTYELLLEGYSSILELLRRREDNNPEKEDSISEVEHNIGNTQAALGQYEQALKSLERVLQFQREAKGTEDLSVADLLFNLGNIHVELGQISLARGCHHECHVISVAVLGDDSIQLAENMVCLGNIEFIDNNFSLALDWFDEALRLLRKKGEYEIAVAKCLHRKAVAHDKLGEYDKSIECFGEVLRLGKRIWGMHHVELSNILNSVGNVHRNRGEVRRALKCYEESLRIRSQAGDELSVANSKNNIGALFMSMDQTDKARRFYAEALTIKTEVLGADSIETSRTLYNIGQVYVTEKKYSDGLRFFTEGMCIRLCVNPTFSGCTSLNYFSFSALHVFKLNLGENHTEVASCLCSIGTVYDEMSDEEEALSFFKKALTAVKGQSGAKGVRAAALHNVGIILTKRNDIDHAVRIFREALELKSSDFETDDKSDTQYNLANVLRLTGCVNEALELHRAALETRMNYLGPEHMDVANSLFGLAQALVDSGSHFEAVKILNECVRIRKKVLGEHNDSVADATFLLGTVLREVGSLDDSLRCLRLALEVKLESCGVDSAEVADISFKLAIVLCEMGKYDEAKTFNLQSLAIRETSEHSKGPEIISIFENMGIIEQKLGEHQVALESFKKAVAMKEARGGESDHDIGAILHAMATSFYELKMYDNAIRFFEDAVKRKKRWFGLKSIEVARVLADEGRVFERTGEHERALMCYEEAVDSDCFEDDSWELGRVFMRMGVTHFALRKPEDAWDCLAEATRIFELVERNERRHGIKAQDSKTRTKRDLHDLIKCYECILRLSEANPTRYNIDRSLVLPKVANILVEIKEYQKASLLYQDAILLQRSLSGDTRFLVATNLHNLGNCLHHLGEFNDALTSLEDALGLFQDIPGIEGKHIADTYHSLGIIHQSRSDMHKALNCYSNALKSRRGNAGEGNMALVTTLVSLGEVLRTLGMYDASIKSCKDAMRMMDTRGDSKLLMVARIVECIGQTHRDRFEFEKSLRCYQESIKKRQEAGRMKSIDLGRAFHDMALVQTMKGEHDKAAAGFQQAYHILKLNIGFELADETSCSVKKTTNLKILAESIALFFEKCYGEYLVGDAEIVVALGSVMDNLGMQAEAVLCNELAIKVIDDHVGSDHLISALAKYRIGAILFKGGTFEKAICRLRESLHIRRAKLGDNHINTEETLKMLSRAYAALGDSEMALFYFKEVVSLRKEGSSHKTDSDSEADLLLRLGKLHLEQQEYVDALTCLKDSLRLQRQSSMNRNEQKLGETLQYMGSTLFQIKQLKEARLTLLSAMRLLERGPDDSQELMNASYLLGRVNEEERSYDKALAWYDRSIIILNRMDKKGDEMRAQVVARIGLVKFAQKSYNDALRLVKQAEDLFLSQNGPHDLAYAACVHSRGRILFDINDFPTARDCFQLALQIRQQHLKVDDLELGESLHCQGATLAELEQFQEASSFLVEALRVRLINFGDSADPVGETQRCLGTVALHLGNSKEATDHFLEAIRIGLKSVQSKEEMTELEFGNLMACFDAVIPMAKNGLYTEILGKLHHQKGTLQSMHKRFKQALNSFTEAIQVYKADHGEDHLNVANALFNVGVCLKETGDSERATKCFARALTITSSQLGDDHVEVADTMQQMAEVYRMKGDLKGAIKMCDQALQIRRNQEDGALAALLNFSGELNASLDESEEAERCFRECVRIRKKLYGDDHIDVAQALYRLGYTLETFRRDYRRALRCFEESLRIRINLMDDKNEETARCYLHLGTAHSALHADAKAFFCYDKAILLCKEMNDPDVSIIEDAIVGRGHRLLARGEPEDALVQYERARNERQERSGVESECSKEIADILVFEANALEKLGRETDAMSSLARALDMYKETVGMDHLGTAGAFQRLSELHLEMGNEEESLSCAQQALTIRKSRLGMHDEATGDSYFVIGKIFLARMDLDAARPCLEAALEIFRSRRGNSHASVADSMYFIGCVLGKLRLDFDIVIYTTFDTNFCSQQNTAKTGMGLFPTSRVPFQSAKRTLVENTFRLHKCCSNWAHRTRGVKSSSWVQIV